MLLSSTHHPCATLISSRQVFWIGMAVYGISSRGYPLLWYEGYWYSKNRETSASITWKCRKRSICSGCLNEKDGVYILSRPHENHEKEPPRCEDGISDDSIMYSDNESVGTPGSGTPAAAHSVSSTSTTPTPSRPPSSRRAAMLARAVPATLKRKTRGQEADSATIPATASAVLANGTKAATAAAVKLDEVHEADLFEDPTVPDSPSKRTKMSVATLGEEVLSADNRKILAGIEGVDLSSVVVHQDGQHIYFGEYEVATEVEIPGAFGASAGIPNSSVRILTFNKGSRANSKVTLGSVEAALANWLKPKVYGEKWDNVGLLVGSGKFAKNEKVINNIYICNDLTTKALSEAMGMNADLIIAYHPPIFSAMKTVGYGSWKEQIVMKCLANDIAIYSPHTCLDAVPGGINDRIIGGLRKIKDDSESVLEAITPAFNSKPTFGISFTSTVNNIATLFELICLNELNEVSVSFNVDKFVEGLDSATLMCYTAETDDETCWVAVQELAKSIGSSDFQVTSGAPEAVMGAGRILRYTKTVKLGDIIDSLRDITKVRNIKLAQGPKKEVTSVAICVGSGASILKGLAVDVLITGEMTHHDVLDCVEAGQSVILLGHADSERHYLQTLAGIVRIVTKCETVVVSSTEDSLFRYA